MKYYFAVIGSSHPTVPLSCCLCLPWAKMTDLQTGRTMCARVCTLTAVAQVTVISTVKENCQIGYATFLSREQYRALIVLSSSTLL